MHGKAVEPAPAEGGQQRGVDVDDAPLVARDKVGAQDAQKAGQHHKVDAVGGKGVQQLAFKVVGAAAPAFHHHGRDAGSLRPLQGVDPGPA